MRIDIQAPHLDLGTDQRAHIQRRASFALSRLSSRIEQVAVYLSDVNGARVGADTQCRVEVKLDRGDPVVVEDMDPDLTALINRSLARAGLAVEKRLNRLVSVRRQHQPTL